MLLVRGAYSYTHTVRRMTNRTQLTRVNCISSSITKRTRTIFIKCDQRLRRIEAIFNLIFIFSLFLFSVVSSSNLVKRSLKDSISCLEDSKFYRNPDRPTHKMWTNAECSKYYLCLDGEVFEFKCSVGLLFDVARQICDFKQNVDNCDVTAGMYLVNCRDLI